eukprot:766393-Hanusia_phi.AAC.9
MKAQRFEKLHQTKSKQVEVKQKMQFGCTSMTSFKDLETKIRSLQKTAEKNEKDAAEVRIDILV